MKIGAVLLTGVLTLALSAGGARAAGAKTAAPRPGPAAADRMMEQMSKNARPSEGHERLKPMAGSFKTTTRSWVPGPDMEISEGECTSQWVMEGRYLREECTGSIGEMPFQGMGLTGYDNAQKKYVSSWIDNMTTGIMSSTGTADASGKILTFQSSMPSPMTGKMTKARLVMKIVDDNSHVLTIYVHMGPKGEQKAMEISYTRK